MLRYRETGELHKDFHGSTSLALDFVADRYGEEGLTEILHGVGTRVYASIHQKLLKDDPSELIEHLAYFYNREEADFDLNVTDREITLRVHQCPAIAHIRRLGLPLSKRFCRSTTGVNAALCEGTPWATETQILAEGQCVQRFYRKERDA
jgi:predicted ArsR family transcriptional regulator